MLIREPHDISHLPKPVGEAGDQPDVPRGWSRVETEGALKPARPKSPPRSGGSKVWKAIGQRPPRLDSNLISRIKIVAAAAGFSSV
jgi:hypothetical protein